MISSMPILWRSLISCLCLFQPNLSKMVLRDLYAFSLISLPYLPLFTLQSVKSFRTSSRLCSWISWTNLVQDIFWTTAIKQKDSYSLTFYFQVKKFQSTRFIIPSRMTPLSSKLLATCTAKILGCVSIFIRAVCKAFSSLTYPTTFCICSGIYSLQLVADTIKPRLRIDILSLGSCIWLTNASINSYLLSIQVSVCSGFALRHLCSAQNAFYRLILLVFLTDIFQTKYSNIQLVQQLIYVIALISHVRYSFLPNFSSTFSKD